MSLAMGISFLSFLNISFEYLWFIVILLWESKLVHGFVYDVFGNLLKVLRIGIDEGSCGYIVDLTRNTTGIVVNETQGLSVEEFIGGPGASESVRDVGCGLIR